MNLRKTKSRTGTVVTAAVRGSSVGSGLNRAPNEASLLSADQPDADAAGSSRGAGRSCRMAQPGLHPLFARVVHTTLGSTKGRRQRVGSTRMNRGLAGLGIAMGVLLTTGTSSAEARPAPPDRGRTSCRVDIRARRVTRLEITVGWHLFIVHTDTRGKRTAFRGDPGDGTIVASASPFNSRHVDYRNGQPSLQVLAGPAACEAKKCFTKEVNRINASRMPYKKLGPNSNSVVTTFLMDCHVPRKKPPGLSTPGWDVRIETGWWAASGYPV